MKYYVYHLIDPRDNSVFYIGKGTGNRINDHQKEALRGALLNVEKEKFNKAVNNITKKNINLRICHD